MGKIQSTREWGRSCGPSPSPAPARRISLVLFQHSRHNTPSSSGAVQGSLALGTKIVKEMVDARGGRITVDSQEDKGTTFHIFLPLHPPSCSDL